MVHFGIDRLWYGHEWERYLEFARVHCARLGFENWKKQELQRFNTSMAMFDDETRWLRWPENLFPLDEKDWSARRNLLFNLRDQFCKYVELIQRHDERI